LNQVEDLVDLWGLHRHHDNTLGRINLHIANIPIILIQKTQYLNV
jgi:hypothetical protein